MMNFYPHEGYHLMNSANHLLRFVHQQQKKKPNHSCIYNTLHNRKFVNHPHSHPRWLPLSWLIYCQFQRLVNMRFCLFESVSINHNFVETVPLHLREQRIKISPNIVGPCHSEPNELTKDHLSSLYSITLTWHKICVSTIRAAETCYATKHYSATTYM